MVDAARNAIGTAPRGVGLFSPERDALMRARYPYEGASPALLIALNALPGPHIAAAQKVSDHAKVLRIRVLNYRVIMSAACARHRAEKQARARVEYAAHAASGPWTDEKVATLRQLWAEGVSTAKIAREIHVSKDAIVGKAHRLGLPSRPSPIIRTGKTKRARHAKRVVQLHGIDAIPVGTAPLPPLASVAAPPPAEVPRPVLPPTLRVVACPCQWPIGEPRKPGFRFCGEDAVAGKPYCASHMSVAYVRVAA